MKIINEHRRQIAASKEKLEAVLDSLASANDLLWPHEHWPPMQFAEGLKIGSEGGHGPIGYFVNDYVPGTFVSFTFTDPPDFHGIHRFELNRVSDSTTELRHFIAMELSAKGIFTWYLAVKWLHDALLEDCLDKVESYCSGEEKRTRWNPWVVMLRWGLSRKRRSVE